MKIMIPMSAEASACGRGKANSWPRPQSVKRQYANQDSNI